MTVTTENQRKRLSAPFFVRGNLIEGEATTHNSRDLGVEFTTPAVDLDELVTPRSTLPPLLDVPLEEIIDFLVETGERLALDKNPHMQQCLDLVAETNPLPRRVVENLYRTAPYLLTREGLWAQVESNFPDPAVLDGWVSRTDADGNSLAIRAFHHGWSTCSPGTRRRDVSHPSPREHSSRQSTCSKCRPRIRSRQWQYYAPWPRSTRNTP